MTKKCKPKKSREAEIRKALEEAKKEIDKLNEFDRLIRRGLIRPVGYCHCPNCLILR